METSCRAETRYLLERAFRTRGCDIQVLEDTFNVSFPEGHFSLTIIPHNKRTLISHSLVVDSMYRGKGFGQKWHELREEVAREAGVNLLLGTVRNDNAPQIHILEKRGWKRLTNRNTGVSLWGKEL